MIDQSDRIRKLKIDRSNRSAAAAKSWWLYALVILIFVIGAWWLTQLGSASSPLVEVDVARKPPNVAAANSVLDASGYVVARLEATVSSKATGKVVEVLVEEGMRVERDQVVARLDDSTQQAQLALVQAQVDSELASLDEIEAQLRIARLERDRLRNLAARDLTSASSLDTAEATYEELTARLETGRENVNVARRNVALAEDALANMTIRAPFAGMVVSKDAQPATVIDKPVSDMDYSATAISTTASSPL